MELKEFVSSTLTGIVEGVLDAQRKTCPLGAIISPGCMMNEKGEHRMVVIERVNGKDSRSVAVSTISFDIAVVLSEKDGKKGGGGISVFNVRADGELKKEKSSENASRIKFDLNVSWPVADHKGPFIDRLSPCEDRLE